jgi:hypothetical protein
MFFGCVFVALAGPLLSTPDTLTHCLYCTSTSCQGHEVTLMHKLCVVLLQVLVLYDAADTMMTDLPSFLQPAVKHVLVPVGRALGFKERYPSHSSAAAAAAAQASSEGAAAGHKAAEQQHDAAAAQLEVDADAAAAEAELKQALRGSEFVGRDEF